MDHEVTAPDGRKFIVTAPDGATQDEIIAYAQQQSAPTGVERAARVAGLGARSIVSGMAGLPLMIGEGLNQAYNIGARTFGGEQRPSVYEGFNTFLNRAGLPQPETPVEKFSAAVTGGMAGAAGQLGAIGQVVPLAIRTMLTQVPGRQIVSAGTASAAANITGQAGGGPIAQTVAGLAGGMVPFAGQLRSPTPEAARTADTASAGRSIGLVFPPSETNPGLVNNTLTGRIAGRSATEQAATLKNQRVVNEFVKRDLGIPATQSASVEQLREIRSDSGKPYQQIARMGQSFSTTPEFRATIAKAADQQRTIAAAGLDLEDASVVKLAGKLENAKQFDGRTLIELTKTLRDKQTAAFRAGETGAGKFYSAAASAVEDLLDSNLSQLGRPDLLNAFRQARTRIAKTYTAEAAINDATGNFSPRLLAQQYDKGNPISGNMGILARSANAFPGALQDAESAAARQAGGSVMDTYGSLHGLGMLLGGPAAGMATGNPAWGALAAVPLIRPAVRSTILSGPYQDAMAIPGSLPTSQAVSFGVLGGTRAAR